MAKTLGVEVSPMSLLERCVGVKVNIISFHVIVVTVFINFIIFEIITYSCRHCFKSRRGLILYLCKSQLTHYTSYLCTHQLSCQFHRDAWNVMKQCHRYAVKINLNSLSISSILQWDFRFQNAVGFPLYQNRHCNTSLCVSSVHIKPLPLPKL